MKNKENKTLNLAFRICLILTWVMSNISVVALLTGFKNIETDGLDKEAAGNALVAYMLPIFILFILTITTIHCLVKKSDPNNKNSGSEE